MQESPAKNTIGYLLQNHITGEYYFRIYKNKSYTDYQIKAEDIKIKILANNISKYKTKTGNYLSWSTKYLKPPRKHHQKATS